MTRYFCKNKYNYNAIVKRVKECTWCCVSLRPPRQVIVTIGTYRRYHFELYSLNVDTTDTSFLRLVSRKSVNTLFYCIVHNPATLIILFKLFYSSLKFWFNSYLAVEFFCLIYFVIRPPSDCFRIGQITKIFPKTIRGFRIFF